MTPSQRTVAHLRKLGYQTANVELHQKVKQ